ncbi:MAG TPA: TetR/AcrR family transcriptional regulator [Azospirillaceae bacterium]|nr:TetR/AcrR family transcriptional regulator [Azospirillaceae bacterium]
MPRPRLETDQDKRREEILRAAFDLFVEKGFHGTSMLDIARRARASKETLYSWFGSKEKLLGALVAWRADAIEVADPPAADQDIAPALEAFGRSLLTLLMQPEVIAVYRIIIAEGPRHPALVEAFDQAGRARLRAAFSRLLETAWRNRQLAFDKPIHAGPVDAGPVDAGDVFVGLLRGELQIQVLLGLREPPDADAIAARAAWATRQFMKLFGVKPPE